MTTYLRSLPLAVAFAAVAAAQDAPLVLRTSNPALAVGVVAMLRDLDPDAERPHVLPEIPDDAHCVITLGQDGAVGARTEAGKRLFELEVVPPKLLERFTSSLPQFRLRTRAALGMLSATMGLDYDEITAIADALVDFPRQVARGTVRIEDLASDERPRFTGRIELTPVPDSWCARLVAALRKPGPGVRRIAADADALALEMSFDAAAVAGPLDAVIAPLSGMWMHTERDRQRSLALTRRSLACLDGSIAVAIPRGVGSSRAIIGLRDAADYDAMVHDPEYAEQQRRVQAGGAGFDVEFQLDAFEHRGATIHRTIIAIDNPGLPSPFVHDGKITTLVGVAGDCLVTAMGTDAEVKALVDKALDAPHERSPLPEGTALTLRFDVATFVQAFVQRELPATFHERMPRSMTMTVGTDQGKLEIEVSVQ